MFHVRSKLCVKIRQRWIFAVMSLLGTIHVYALRACLPITMTEMVILIQSEVYLDESCPADVSAEMNTTDGISHYLDKKYDWSEYTQGVILSSFYYGYIITHIPAGILAAKYGGKHILGFGIFIASVCTLLIPLTVTYAGSSGLIGLRVLIGLGGGFVYPAVSTMLSHWTPPEERSRTGSFVYSGEILGTIYANFAGGSLLHYFGNWSSVFYVVSGTGIIWYLAWLVLCYNNPKEHPFISKIEADFLNERIGQHRQEKPGSVPWSHVVRSGPIWAAAIALFAFVWSIVTILTYLPKYMSSVLKCSVETNGYMNSLVGICMWIGSIISSWFADSAIEKNYASRTTVRKISTFGCLIGSASFVVAASYAGCDQILVTVMFAISMALLAIGYCCIEINALDLSPNYAGTLMAIFNATSCGIGGVLSPYIISILTPNQTLSEWRLIFWLLFIFSVTATAIYFYFGSGEVQYWNDPKNTSGLVLKAEDKMSENSNITEVNLPSLEV